MILQMCNRVDVNYISVTVHDYDIVEVDVQG